MANSSARLEGFGRTSNEQNKEGRWRMKGVSLRNGAEVSFSLRERSNEIQRTGGEKRPRGGTASLRAERQWKEERAVLPFGTQQTATRKSTRRGRTQKQEQNERGTVSCTSWRGRRERSARGGQWLQINFTGKNKLSLCLVVVSSCRQSEEGRRKQNGRKWG